MEGAPARGALSGCRDGDERIGTGLLLPARGGDDRGVHPFGLSRDVASQLIIQTMLGSAKMLRDTGTHPVELREMVTSPGGTTIEAIRHRGGRRARRLPERDRCREAPQRGARAGRRRGRLRIRGRRRHGTRWIRRRCATRATAGGRRRNARSGRPPSAPPRGRKPRRRNRTHGRAPRRFPRVPIPSAASSTSAPGQSRRFGSSSRAGNGPSANALPLERRPSRCSRDQVEQAPRRPVQVPSRARSRRPWLAGTSPAHRARRP